LKLGSEWTRNNCELQVNSLSPRECGRLYYEKRAFNRARFSYSRRQNTQLLLPFLATSPCAFLFMNLGCLALLVIFFLWAWYTK
jgi:hypothetical protein